MKFTKREVSAAFREFSAVASSLAGKRVPVKHSEEPGQLGYTTQEGIIYLGVNEEQYNELSKKEGFIFLRGVFTHETLHILITDFTQYMPAIMKHRDVNRFEGELFANLLNIAEDGAIEYFSPGYMSAEYVRSLEFVRATLYRQAEELETDDDPLGQFLSALLHFRFFGFLKGHFTDNTARETFNRCVPELSAAFEEPQQAKRIEHVENILELSRPLWEERAKQSEEMEKAMKSLMDDLMNAFGVSGNNGSGKGNDFSDPEAGAESSLSKRRKITVLKVSAEEYKKALESASDADPPSPDADITILIPDEPVEEKKNENKDGIPVPAPVELSSTEDKNSESSDEGDSSENEESSSNGKENADTDKASEDANDTSSIQTKDSPASSRDSEGHPHVQETPDTPDVTRDPDDYTGSTDMREEMDKELLLTEDELLAIDELSERYTSEDEEEKRARSETDETDFDLPVGGGFQNVCKHARCQNIWVKCSKTPAVQKSYDAIVSSMSGSINGLASQLKRILHNRQEENVYKTSGKISMKRLNCGRATSRVFNKKRYPETSDIAVAIAVDISGSMYGENIVSARKTAIALAEVFGKLNIPIYIFGFTADEAGYDVNHYHYLNWSNQKSDRLRLLSISARSNNFDGYSIRYAAELLKRKDADKKLLFVISDGAPAAYAYNHVNGCQDVQLAVSEANRVATTIGILLGGADPTKHRQMYGYNFVHCRTVNELFPQLAKLLKKYI